MRAGKSGFKEVKLASGSVLDVAYSPVVGTSFSLGIAAKQSVLLKVVADLQKQVNSSTQQMVWGRVMPIGIVLLAVVWFYGFFYIRRFSDPINKLTAKTAQLATGNFDIDPVVISAKNEIGQLAKAFNAMVADLKTSHTKIEDQNEALTREQVRLKASINSMPFGFAIVGLEGDVVFHNAVLAHLVGRDIPDEPAASRRVLKEVSHEYKAAIDLLGSIKATLDTHRAHEKEVEIGTHFFRFFFAPIIDVVDGSEQAIGTLMVMEDVTEARALERSREEFFSIASHELRTPLTAIRGNTDMVLNYYQEQLKDPALHEMITDIHDGSVRLISIVNDFLDVSRLEQQRLEFKNAPFDIVALVNETLHEYNVTGSRKNLSLELEPPTGDVPQVLADRDRTRQILINLVGNAIKFTEKGGVKIQLKPKDNTMEITVTDTGRGIPDKYIHLLFRKFQQATQSILTRDDTKGTGLGLYISRLLAVGMNGNLALKSTKEGEGTAFTLTLPLAPAGQAADAGKDKPTPPTPAAS